MNIQAPPKDTEPTLARLLEELRDFDRDLVDADRALKLAQANHEVASVKFVAIRDILRSHMQGSPYAGKGGIGGWRLIRDGQDIIIQFASQGRFRYYRTSPGDAVEEVLSEATEAMSVYEIFTVLSEGGAEGASPRGVNAALTNKVGKTVVKMDDGRYRKKDKDDLADLFAEFTEATDGPAARDGDINDPNDLPFE
jgi:hypothetical protein